MASNIWKTGGNLDLNKINSDLDLIHILHYFPNCWNQVTTLANHLLFVPNTFTFLEQIKTHLQKLMKFLIVIKTIKAWW